MAEPYNHRAVEQKWRQKWEENPINVNDGKKPKYYCLDMFPYPSGSGLHVGHWRGYVISDVWSRYKMLQGYYLIHDIFYNESILPHTYLKIFRRSFISTLSSFSTSAASSCISFNSIF